MFLFISIHGFIMIDSKSAIDKCFFLKCCIYEIFQSIYNTLTNIIKISSDTTPKSFLFLIFDQ